MNDCRRSQVDVDKGDLDLERVVADELVDLMFNWYATYGVEVIGYERTNFTEGMKAYLDSEMRRRNQFLPLME